MKQITPGLSAQGAVCRLPASDDTDSPTTNVLRCQYLSRLGLSPNRAAIIAPFAFGQAMPHA